MHLLQMFEETLEVSLFPNELNKRLLHIPSESSKVSIVAGSVEHLKKMIQESIEVSLIAVNNIIVKKVSLTVSLIAVNVIDYRFHLLQRCGPIISLSINATASFNQLLRYDRMTIFGSDKERCAPILPLKIHVTASFNEQVRDSHTPFFGSDEQASLPRFPSGATSRAR